MAYRVVGVNSLEDGSFYFRAQHWPDEAAMRRGDFPEWENDFVTDLHLLAGRTLSRVKTQHDLVGRVSLMQRADTLEWAPLAEWHAADGLLAQGVEPAREEFAVGQAEVDAMVRDTVRRYIARRGSVPSAPNAVSAEAVAGAEHESNGIAAATSDMTDPRLRWLPSRKAALHPHLQAVEGLEETSL